MGRPWYEAEHTGTVAGAWGDLEGTADQAGTVLHDPKAESFAVGGERVDAFAVVEDGQSEVSVGDQEGEGNPFWGAVFDGIADRFLGDAEEVTSDGDLGNEHGSGADDSAAEMVDVGGLSGEFAERHHEGLRVVANRREAAGGATGVFDGLPNQVKDAGCRFGFRRFSFREAVSKDTGKVSDAAELLTETVVQFVGDPALLTIGTLQEFPFELEPAGDVPDEPTGMEKGAAFPSAVHLDQNVTGLSLE